MSAVADARRELGQTRTFVQQRRSEVETGLARAAGAHLAAQRQWTERAQLTADTIRTLAAAGSPVAYDDWGGSRWMGWKPEEGLPAELRIGSITLDGSDLPATVPLLGGRPIVIASGSPAAGQVAHGLMSSLAVRCALAGGDRATLHFVDPYQEGYGFEFRQELPRVAARTDDAAADLRAVVSAAHAARALHNDIAWSDLDEATRNVAPVHFVFALDFPRAYSYQAVGELSRLARLAPAGVQLVLHHDLTADPPAGTGGLELTRSTEVLVEDFGTARGPWGALECRIDQVPDEAVVAGLAGQVPRPEDELPVTATTDALLWTDVNDADPARWWHGSASSVASATIGRTSDGRSLELRFGQDGDWHNHAVVAGEPGSGKSVLLHAAILELATEYSPEDLRLFIIDGQNGVEMQSYATLPHAELVTLNTPLALARGVLLDIDAELERRDHLLTSTGTSSITEYRARFGNREMPRLVVVLDEYQRLFAGDDKDATAGVLQRIAAQGRKVGVHLFLSSQRLHATGLLNQDALFNNISTRISLSLPTDAIDGIDEFARDGRELIRSHCTAPGRVVLNDRGGKEGASRAGTVAFCDGEVRRDLVASLADRAARSGAEVRPVVINGTQPPQVATNRALTRLARLEGDAAALAAWARAFPRDGGLGLGSWQAYDHPFAFIVGRTFTVYGSAVAKVERRTRQNVLLVASDPEALTGMVLTGLVSAGLSVPGGSLTICVLNELPGSGSWTAALTEHLAVLSSPRRHRVVAPASVPDVADRLAAAVTELDRRRGLDPEELAELGPYVAVGISLERLPDFRRVEGRYGSEPSPAGALLLRLLGEGPLVGVHVVLGSASRSEFQQVLDAKDVRFFQHRVVQQMSADDSRILLDDSSATRIATPGESGPQRAGYRNAETTEEQVFLPYSTGNTLVSELAGLVGLPGGAA